MTTLALLYQTPSLLQKIADGISSFFTGIDNARARARHYRALARLTDAELAQRGLKREDIANVVLTTSRS